MADSVRIGMTGVGYWGSKLARNIYESRECDLAWIVDPDPALRSAAADRYGCPAFSDLGEALAQGAADGVVLATPASMHAEHARQCLEAGAGVMVEKPLALTGAEARSLTSLADSRGLVLMVGHTFLFSEPVRYLRQLIADGSLGDVLYVYSQRLNLGIIRDDLNALWNLGPHDIAIALYLLDDRPARVSSRQYALLSRELEDVAFVTLEFDAGPVVHIHESWLDPRKVRLLTIVGSKAMAVYDDTDGDSPIRIYDTGVVAHDEDGQEVPLGQRAPEVGESFAQFKLLTRAGDMHAPRLVGAEPLRSEIDHFAASLRGDHPPLTDGAHGADVVAVLEAADASSAQGGAVVPVDW